MGLVFVGGCSKESNPAPAPAPSTMIPVSPSPPVSVTPPAPPTVRRGTWGALPYGLSDATTPDYDAEARGSFSSVGGLTVSNGDYFVLTGIDDAHRRGATGEGVLVTVIDGLVDFQIPDLNSSPDKLTCLSCPTSLAGYTDADGDVRYGSINHGLGIAGIIAADRDGQGILGIAYDAKIQIIDSRAGSAGPTAPPSIDLSRYADGDLGETVESFLRRARTLGQKSQITNISWGWISVLSDKRIFDSDSSNDNDPLYTPANVRAAFAPLLPELAQNPQIVVVSAGNLHGRTQRLCQDASCPTRVVDADSVDILSGLPYFLQELRGLWIATVAVDRDGTIASFSNRCGLAKNYCIAAPGVNIWSPYISTFGITTYSLALRSGTSFAAPFVVGGLALIIDQFRGQLSLTEVVARLFSTANKTGVYADTDVYGQGLIDLDAATRPIGRTGILTQTGDIVNPSPLSSSPLFGSALHSAVQGREIALFDEQGAPFFIPLSALFDTQKTFSTVPMQKNFSPAKKSFLFFEGEAKNQPYLGLVQNQIIFGAEHDWKALYVQGYFFLGNSFWEQNISGDISGDVQGFVVTSRLGKNFAVTAQAGFVWEHNSFLGARLGHAHTVFGGFAAHFRLTQNLQLRAAHHMGMTRGASAHPLIADVSEISSSAMEVSVTKKSFFGKGDLTLRVQRHLQVDNGRLHIRYATGRTPKKTILWETLEIDLSQQWQDQLELDAVYQHPLQGGHVRMQISYRPQRSDAFFGIFLRQPF